MNWHGLAILWLASAVLVSAETMVAHAGNGTQPIPRIAYFKTEPPSDLAHLDISPEYYFWLCFDEAPGWEHEFLISYLLDKPQMVLSNTWSPGFRYENGWYQKVHIDSAFLEHGNVNLDVLFDAKTSNETWAVGIDIAEFLNSDGIGKYVVTRDDTFFATSAPCANAKPLEDRHMCSRVRSHI